MAAHAIPSPSWTIIRWRYCLLKAYPRKTPAKMTIEKIRIFFLPNLSEREPQTGELMAAATAPAVKRLPISLFVRPSEAM
jgi:hypothetical protein